MVAVIALVFLTLLGGCLQSASNNCDRGVVCPAGLKCTMPGETPVCVPQSCGNGQLDPGEACDDGNNISGDGCPADCRPPCGDGVVDPGEACDDSNNTSGDGCSADCKSTETCGNGIVDVGEGCDDGNAADGDGCTNRCVIEQPTWRALSTTPGRVAGHAMAYDAGRGMTVLFGGQGPDGLSSDTWEWDGVFWQRRTPSTVPPARSGHAMAYDATRQRVVMFGAGSEAEHSTWEWDGADWHELLPPASPQPQLVAAAMTYNAALQQVVLFGGALDGVAQSAAWAWDGTTWRSLAAGPPARAGGAMTYDSARGVVVLFGGVAGGHRLGDTWEFDGTSWAARSPSTAPPARAHAVMAFDAARGTAVLVGGDLDAPGSALVDTWEWNGAQWSMSVSAPQARSQAAAVYDSARGLLIMLGGQLTAGGTAIAGLFSDMWTWDGAWARRAASVAVPGNRDTAAWVYDPVRGKAVLFGGDSTQTNPSSAISDTWEWDGASWIANASAAVPLARARAAIASDGTHVVLFGGDTETGRFEGNFLADTWILSGTQWTQVTPALSPSARASSAMAFDTAHGKIILFGGIDGNSTLFGDTWMWDGAHWAQQRPAHVPPARYNHALAYDDARGRILLVGGHGPGGVDGPTSLGDMWEWTGTDWVQDAPPQAPPAFNGSPTMAYDSARDRLVVFGDSQTWEWDGTTWLQRTSVTVPSPVTVAELTYDARRGRVVMLDGGSGFLDDHHSLTVWEWDGVDWHASSPDTGQPPSRTGFSLAYDQAHASALLFGGLGEANGFSTGTFSDTWIWNGATWQLQAPAAAPTARSFHAMAFDTSRGRAVLFGGESSATLLNDTWQWDGAGWMQMSPAKAPPARVGHAMVYDANHAVTLVLGGIIVSPDPDELGNPVAATDLWAWDGTGWTDITPADLPAVVGGWGAAYDPARKLVVMSGYTSSNGAMDVWEWDGARLTARPADGDQPPARAGGALVYSTERARIVLFGGSTASGPLADMWEWDGTRWTQLTPAAGPVPRTGLGLIDDASHHWLMMFGGNDGSGNTLQDTWLFRYEAGF